MTLYITQVATIGGGAANGKGNPLDDEKLHATDDEEDGKGKGKKTKKGGGPGVNGCTGGGPNGGGPNGGGPNGGGPNGGGAKKGREYDQPKFDGSGLKVHSGGLKEDLLPHGCRDDLYCYEIRTRRYFFSL